MRDGLLLTPTSEVPEAQQEGIWRQIIETFRGGILADWSVTHACCVKSCSNWLPRSSAADSFPLDVQEAEENFDLALIAALEIDVIPYLGESCIPDYLIIHQSSVHHQGSQIRDADDDLPPSPASITDAHWDTKTRRLSQEFEKVEKFGADVVTLGTTESGHFRPRERFSFWCLDLLFLVCSDTAQGKCSG